MLVVLDVNVLVSALISPRGAPAAILRLWENEQFDLAASPPILEELARVAHYPKIQKRYKLSAEKVTQFIQLIGRGAIIAEPAKELSVIEEDPSDNRYLECAKETGAAYIVTGDAHLLELKEFEGIVILPPAGFLALLRLEEKKKK